jgi:hypothetical protein
MTPPDVESDACDHTPKIYTKRKREHVDASNANGMFPGPFCFTPFSSSSAGLVAVPPTEPEDEDIASLEETSTKKNEFWCRVKGCVRIGSFTRKGHRNTHEKVHTGVKDYKCSFDGCCKFFAQSGHRSIHERIHRGEKSYKCSFDGCNKAFTQSGNRYTHERTHIGERRYKCSRCEKAFTQSVNRDSHESWHNGEKKYECSVDGCNIAFTYRGSLDDHVKRHHWDRDSSEYIEWNDKIKAVRRLRYHSNTEYRAAKLCRDRLRHMLKSQGGKKQAHTHELIGCTWAKLVAHLNDNIFGYKVGDKGIQIDHIRPCASFQLADNPVEQMACMNFNNLQLLPAEENYRKSDEYDAAVYAEMPCGKAIAVLTVGWKKQFPTGTTDDVDFDSDSEWEEEDEEDEDVVVYEMEM